MASPKKERQSLDTMACLAHKRELSSFVPAAPIALLVRIEGEGKNSLFLDCKMIEGTPQTMGANNQTAGVNNHTPMHISPFVQPPNERSTPRGFSGSTETPVYRPTSTVPHGVPEGSANMQQPYSIPRMLQSSATVQLPPAIAHVPEGSASVP
ncbi:hypothetical protein H4S08_004745 [Coemansia sp. RSA 1365]|nr:hypothetical protein H4S08_004745 [Coemansia sp. RSA 1365]